jgi:tyrosinase
MKRSRFLFSSASAAALAACSQSGLAPDPRGLGSSSLLDSVAKRSSFTRLEIREFSKNPRLVAAFRAGIKAMREIDDAQNVAAYKYWHYSHWMPESDPPPNMISVWDQCKHGASYFISWHRGFLYYFEKILRQASGEAQFALPYWDYYANPNLPEIFAEPLLHDGSPNPLYWPDRLRSTVEGLSYAAFAGDVTVFPWGPGSTFEDLIERNPHNRVHGQVGGTMGAVPTAPADPVFWVHHCNIDRYWAAWLAAGRDMPPAHQALFWDERFAYDLKGEWHLSIREMNRTEQLGYQYDNVKFPVAPANAMLPPRPRTVAAGSRDGFGGLSLGLRSLTIDIPLDEAVASADAVDVTLEGVQLTTQGARGGYDYSIYANLPERPTPLAKQPAYEIGEFGSFALSMPKMAMGSALGGRTLRFRAATPGRTLRLSFVAYGGATGMSRDTELVRIGRIVVTPR